MKHLKIRSVALLLISLLCGAAAAHAAKDGWLTSYDQALAQAKKEGKNVLINFHGSDWCPPCIKLSKEVLATKAFKKKAAAELVLVDADFPRKSPLPAEQKRHNEELAGKFGVQYFPTVVLIDGDGNVIDKIVGFPKDGLEGFLTFISAKAAAPRG